MSFQKTVPLVSVSRLHLIVTVQARQGGLCDVNLPVEKGMEIRVQGRQTVGPHDAGEGGWDQSGGSRDQTFDVSSESNGKPI